MSPNRPHPVAVLAFDGVVLGDLAAPCELFGRARHASGALAYRVRVCSARPEVKAGLVALSTRWRLSALARAETIIVPGVEEIGGSLPAPELRALRRAIARGARVASICTGAFLLAQTGALDGLTATTHWRAAAELARRHPRVAVDPSVLYVDNGRLLTSAGAAAGMDLCLHLIRRDLGAVAAAAVARDAVMAPERSGGQAQFMVGPEPAGDEASSLGTLLAWLEAHLAEPLHLEAIARKAAMSTRTLSRRFREGVGATPAAWVNEKRVRRAQQLLETSSLSVERVAAGVGFGSATVLREHFGRVVGTTPTAYRRAFSVR
ncbi:MAG: helix-turn-helix domain-containing protein [Archangiaceae bacterium]|nr:helix-turn-helix domain-containing protein [Archangiaceae bacterium]